MGLGLEQVHRTVRRVADDWSFPQVRNAGIRHINCARNDVSTALSGWCSTWNVGISSHARGNRGPEEAKG